MSEPIRTLIADDEPLARVLLRELVATDSFFEIVGEPADGSDTLQAIETRRPELVFLDIEMPGLSGLEVVDRLPPDSEPYIVFVTAFDRYAIEAFEIHALDYLVKPIELDRFQACIERVKETFRRRRLEQLAERVVGLTRDLECTAEEQSPLKPSALTFRDKGRWRRIDHSEIIRLEAANQYVRVHTKSRSYLLSSTLSGLETEFDPDRFLRIHRSTIVNLEFVDEVHTAGHGAHWILLRGGKRLRLSRSRRRLLPKILAGCG